MTESTPATRNAQRLYDNLQVLSGDRVRMALFDIVKTLYPNGDLTFEWDTSQIEEIAKIVQDAGLTREFEKADGHVVGGY